MLNPPLKTKKRLANEYAKLMDYKIYAGSNKFDYKSPTGVLWIIAELIYHMLKIGFVIKTSPGHYKLDILRIYNFNGYLKKKEADGLFNLAFYVS